jgi:ankyrin repeat protein
LKKVATKLRDACNKGDAAAVTRLFRDEGGAAAINACLENGTRPIHIAVRKGSVPIATKLLDSGARVTEVDSEGRTALHDAAGALVHSDVLVNMFCTERPGDMGRLVAAKTNRGRTALHEATAAGNVRAAEILIAQGEMADVSVNEVDEEGRSALLLALQCHKQAARKGVVELLLSKGASPLSRGVMEAAKAASGTDMEDIRDLLRHEIVRRGRADFTPVVDRWCRVVQGGRLFNSQVALQAALRRGADVISTESPHIGAALERVRK